MSLTSFSFFVFLSAAVLLYYLVRPAQKYVLLLASIYFYISISTVSRVKLCLLIVFVGLVTYCGALLIGKTEGVRKKLILGFSILTLASVLFVFKYAYNVFTLFSAILRRPTDFSWIRFGAVIGLSYYALSAIGYLIDVYWGSYQAEKNIADVFLFVFYFPQIVSGPLTRFGEMHPRLAGKHRFDVNNILYGARRMAWGYFKKLVISERFALVVSGVYGNYTNYSFAGIVGATLCYAVQLYTDFSGCMDIIMGASMMFGIELPENFNAPFFSESIQEFWQRWHITLGVWFKDYLMYPLQKSGGIQKIGKWARKKFGKKNGKKVSVYLSMSVLWLLIGLWHGGTGYYFLASAGIPFALLMLSDLMQPVFKKMIALFHVNTKCESWKWFRRIRTLLLICICWMVVCSESFRGFLAVAKHAASDLWAWTSLNAACEALGLTVTDVLLMSAGVVLLYLADLCTYRGESIFKVMDRQNYLLKVLLIYIEILTIFLCGMVGASSFIYFQF